MKAAKNARRRPAVRANSTILAQIAMHPSIHGRLKAEAALDGCTLTGKLHRILCEHFGRPELAEQVPDYRKR